MRFTNRGTTDTPSRRYIGPLPPAGVWTRLDVPASIVSLTGANITGENFILYDGHAWFDRAAKASCSFSTAAAPSSLPSTDTVWFDDSLPTGATSTNWTWDTAQHASGTQSSTHPFATGTTQHSLSGATDAMTAATGEKFVFYALLDPCTTPGEIMVQLYANGSWEHRAFWGGDEIAAASKTRIGDRPPSGQWLAEPAPRSRRRAAAKSPSACRVRSRWGLLFAQLSHHRGTEITEQFSVSSVSLWRNRGVAA